MRKIVFLSAIISFLAQHFFFFQQEFFSWHKNILLQQENSSCCERKKLQQGKKNISRKKFLGIKNHFFRRIFLNL